MTDCEICGGTGVDYLGRKCRSCTVSTGKLDKVLNELAQIAKDVDHEATTIDAYGYLSESDNLHNAAGKLKLLVSLLRGSSA